MLWLRRLGMLAAVLIVVLLALVLGLFITKSHESREGAPPGLVQGRLQPCPSTPNCVSSEAGEDAAHRIDPLNVTSSADKPPMMRVQTALVEMGGNLETVDKDYLAATFRSEIFGFVDDLEVRWDPSSQQVQVRSASRVGHSDMDVNRKRVEALRKRLQ